MDIGFQIEISKKADKIERLAFAARTTSSPYGMRLMPITQIGDVALR
jgi:hypothetical protein